MSIALVQPPVVVELERRPTRDALGHGSGRATYSFAAVGARADEGAPTQLDIYDVTPPSLALRLEESLQDGCDAPPVLGGVPE